MNRVFKNRIDNDWIAQNSYRRFKLHLWPLLPKFYVTKLIRSNLCADYIAERWKIRVVKLIRDPVDVIGSQWKVRFPWLFDLERFRCQEKLQDVLSARTGICLADVQEPFDKLVVRWGIENLLFRHSDKIKIYKYEKLKADYSLVENIMHSSGMTIPPDLYSHLDQPSSKTHPKSEIIVGKKLDEYALSVKQKSIVASILNTFPRYPEFFGDSSTRVAEGME